MKASTAILISPEANTISPVMACSAVIAGSDVGNDLQARSEQASFHLFCPQDVGMGREQER
ncbi:MAG: hypothetical protein Tsb002_26510 [Wenzhouxiangellaceae bacterium]